MLVGLLGCSGGEPGAGETSESFGTGDTTGVLPTGTSTGGSSGVGSSGTGTGSGSGTDTDGEPVVLCPRLDVSLVMDPSAPAFDVGSRAALQQHLDTLVAQTGAEVRVFANVGTEIPWNPGCTTGLAEAGDGRVLIYGRNFEVLPEAPDALACFLDGMQSYQGAMDDGDYMFSGLMFPVLDEPNWPSPDVVGLAIMMAQYDDDLGGMYSRPGMASEAYLRLVAGNDRRRASALTVGTIADELELFALTLGDNSLFADHATTSVAEALAAWTPMAMQTCADHDALPRPMPTDGCKHLDVLFVIDGSYSMLEEQQALRGISGPPVFKDFTDALLAQLTELEDFRVGVVSSQPGDTAMHTHSDQPEVPPTVDTDCGLSPAAPWVTGPSPTLEQEFACVAATKAATEEYTALNAAEALHDPANAGFLREDAVLLVVMLTDEDTQEYLDGHTQVEMRQRLLEAVGHDLSRVFVLAIAGDQGVFEAPKTTCGGPYGTATPGRRLSSIVFSFREQGSVQDICGGSLADVFGEVLDEVVSTCEAFVPPG